MRPVRRTLDDVLDMHLHGEDVPEHEEAAALDWAWFSAELGAKAPAGLPDIPGASESARAVFAMLGDVVDSRRAVPDAIGALAKRAGWDDAPPNSLGESAWRWLARQWLVPPLMELVERKIVKPLDSGGLVMLRGPR